jgi:hypothetical protein
MNSECFLFTSSMTPWSSVVFVLRVPDLGGTSSVDPTTRGLDKEVLDYARSQNSMSGVKPMLITEDIA